MGACRGTCAYEAKLIRRHLLRWGRHFSTQLGLERVLLELLGEQRDRRPRYLVEGPRVEPHDWTPSTCTTPCLCPAYRSPAVVAGADLPQAPAMPADGREPAPPGAAALVAPRGASPGLSGRAASPDGRWRRSPVISSAAPVPDLLPMTDAYAYYRAILAHKADSPPMMEPAVDDEQPLDLSCNRRVHPAAPSSPLHHCEPPAAPAATKRPYTEEELQAALRDIQSGRLGTRRAAVIYGIPRSTLRNKVYRLAAQEKRAEAQRQQEAEALSQSHTPPPIPDAGPLQTEPLLPEPLLERSATATAEAESEAAKAPAPGVCQLLLARLTRPAEPAPLQAVMSWMYRGVLQRALQSRELPPPAPEPPPGWENFVRRMTHERFNEVLAQMRGPSSETPPPPPLVTVPGWGSPTGVDITELSDSNASNCSPPPAKRTRVHSPLTETNNNKLTTKQTKGSRPKRGKYRNYKRSHLVDAVHAVQSGQMSVHRAGNFYGVPHSTLEYKVKQRHLDRPSKRDRTGTSSGGEAPSPAPDSPTPAERVATSGGTMILAADSPPPATTPLVPDQLLRRLQLSVSDPDPNQDGYQSTPAQSAPRHRTSPPPTLETADTI